MSEHDEQVWLFQMLAYHPELWVVFAIPNGGLRNKVTAARLKQEGVLSGVFDIYVPIPRGGYHGLFVEMKFGKNKLTPAQVKFGEAMTGYKYQCKVAYSGEEAYNLILDYVGGEKHVW